MKEMKIAIENDTHVYDAVSLYLCVWVWDVYKELSTGKMSKRAKSRGVNKQTNNWEGERKRDEVDDDPRLHASIPIQTNRIGNRGLLYIIILRFVSLLFFFFFFHLSLCFVLLSPTLFPLLPSFLPSFLLLYPPPPFIYPFLHHFLRTHLPPSFLSPLLSHIFILH